MHLCGEEVQWAVIEAKNDHSSLNAWRLLSEMLLTPKNSGGEPLTPEEVDAVHRQEVHVFPRAELAGSRIISCRYLT